MSESKLSYRHPAIGSTPNAESVREFEPRVAATLGSMNAEEILRNSEGVASPLSQAGRNSFRVAMNLFAVSIPRVSKQTLGWN